MESSETSGHDDVRAVAARPAQAARAARLVALARALARPWRTLSARIAGTVAVGVLAIMALAHALHVRLVNDEMQPQIGKQLFAAVVRAADDVDGRVERRVRALEALAFDIFKEARTLDARSAHEFLHTQSGMLSLFEHLMVVGPDGHVLADRPRVAGVTGLDVSDREYFSRARDTSRIAISQPLRSRVGDFIVLAMAVPLVAADGGFGGAIVGSTNLVTSGLFADIRDAQIGESGYFWAATMAGTVIVHPDRKRMLEPIPDAAADPGLHRALGGWSGWVEQDTAGTQALAAYKRLKQVPWVVVAVQPSAEAFAALAKVDRLLLASRAAAVVLLTLLVWMVVSMALTPLARLREQIDELEDGRRRGAVDARGAAEIASVAKAFNRLVDKQQRLGDALAQREAFHRTLNDSAPVGVFLIDEQGSLTYCNARFEQMAGRPFDRLCGWRWVDAIHEEDRAGARERWLAARWGRQGFTQEYRFVQPNGEVVWARVHHEPMGQPARAPEYLGAVLDVTAEREAIARLQSERQQGQLILETIRDALVVVSGNGRVRDMTRAAEALTGWPRDKANGTQIGRVVRVLDAEGAPVDLAEIIDQPTFRTENWSCETANGESIAVELVWHCFDEAATGGGVLALRDITERRREAERVAWAATHDPLTGLANRRAFEDALAQAHATFLRSGRPAAVVMIDLDRFKQVNDRGGHDAGDEMLRQVTRVLGDNVRASDVAARLGGDEFALLLHGCREDRGERIAESIRDGIASLSVERRGVALRVGASIGISCFAESDSDALCALQRADAASYGAKSAGRNAIRVARTPALDRSACAKREHPCDDCEANAGGDCPRQRVS
jgi:diguanylate cyclase (GGDEF)-like protein/PAS domain S-box-containing protein